MKNENVEVVIVGGSLVGLSTSIFLSARGIKNTVIERHLGSHPHPRAMGYTEHTLEFFRSVGLGDKIPQMPAEARLRRVRVESLSGKWIEEYPWTPGKVTTQPGTFSPTTGAAIPQDKLEPLLRRRAIELGSDLRLGYEVIGFEQTEDRVSVSIENRNTHEQSTIHAKYLIAADGAESPIREQLHVKRLGVGYLQTVRSVLFSCPEADTYLDRGVQQFEIAQEGFKAFLTTYHDGRWVLMFSDDLERSEEQLKEAIQKALGKEMGFKIITTGKWEMKGLIAEKYSDGRVFLVGDSAHQLPPTRGGFGANTGIDDAFNLAWKLEYVIKGLSSEKLLSTYNDERQPIGVLRHDQTFARPDYQRATGKTFADQTLYSDVAMELGQLLRSSSVIGAGTELPPAASPEEWAGQPGVRAPHAWVIHKGKRASTVDLFLKDFVLISRDPRYREYAQTMTEKTGIQVRSLIVGEDIEFEGEGQFERLFGVGKDGASLVRPDGVVGFRTASYSNVTKNDVIDALMKIAAAVVR